MYEGFDDLQHNLLLSNTFDKADAISSCEASLVGEQLKYIKKCTLDIIHLTKSINSYREASLIVISHYIA